MVIQSSPVELPRFPPRRVVLVFFIIWRAVVFGRRLHSFLLGKNQAEPGWVMGWFDKFTLLQLTGWAAAGLQHRTSVLQGCRMIPEGLTAETQGATSMFPFIWRRKARAKHLCTQLTAADSKPAATEQVYLLVSRPIQAWRKLFLPSGQSIARHCVSCSFLPLLPPDARGQRRCTVSSTPGTGPAEILMDRIVFHKQWHTVGSKCTVHCFHLPMLPLQFRKFNKFIHEAENRVWAKFSNITFLLPFNPHIWAFKLLLQCTVKNIAMIKRLKSQKHLFS